MSQKTVKARTLERAAHLVGGTHKLAQALRAPSVEVARWIEGEEEPPQVYFLRAVDLVLADPEHDDIEPTHKHASSGKPRNAGSR